MVLIDRLFIIKGFTSFAEVLTFGRLPRSWLPISFSYDLLPGLLRLFSTCQETTFHWWWKGQETSCLMIIPRWDENLLFLLTICKGKWSVVLPYQVSKFYLFNRKKTLHQSIRNWYHCCYFVVIYEDFSESEGRN